MPLKLTIRGQRRSLFWNAYLYRLPLQVREIQQDIHGTCYPVCPRCKYTIEREYMNYCDRCGQKLGWELLDYATIVYAPRKTKPNI